MACRIFSCGMWNLVPWPGIRPRPPGLWAWILSHWTTREVLSQQFLKFLLGTGTHYSDPTSSVQTQQRDAEPQPPTGRGEQGEFSSTFPEKEESRNKLTSKVQCSMSVRNVSPRAHPEAGRAEEGKWRLERPERGGPDTPGRSDRSPGQDRWQHTRLHV